MAATCEWNAISIAIMGIEVGLLASESEGTTRCRFFETVAQVCELHWNNDLSSVTGLEWDGLDAKTSL